MKRAASASILAGLCLIGWQAEAQFFGSSADGFGRDGGTAFNRPPDGVLPSALAARGSAGDGFSSVGIFNFAPDGGGPAPTAFAGGGTGADGFDHQSVFSVRPDGASDLLLVFSSGASGGDGFDHTGINNLRLDGRVDPVAAFSSSANGDGFDRGVLFNFRPDAQGDPLAAFSGAGSGGDGFFRTSLANFRADGQTDPITAFSGSAAGADGFDRQGLANTRPDGLSDPLAAFSGSPAGGDGFDRAGILNLFLSGSLDLSAYLGGGSGGDGWASKLVANFTAAPLASAAFGGGGGGGDGFDWGPFPQNDRIDTIFPTPLLSPTSAEVFGGNGNGLIGPNECNHLSLVVTNTTSASVTSVFATLSTTTPHVVITQPFSSYPDIPFGGTVANTTPFQISTLPTLACGGTIDLLLTLSTSAGDVESAFTLPTDCVDGGGFCATCPGAITNSITVNDTLRTIRIPFDGQISTCANPKFCVVQFVTNAFHYDVHAFTNAGGPACVSVVLDDACGDLFVAAYLGSSNVPGCSPAYLADPGTKGSFLSFSFTAPAATNFEIIVNNSTVAPCDYTLVVSGIPCPPPTLGIGPLTADRIRVDWPTFAAGYFLEESSSLSLQGFQPVTNQPIVSGSRFAVTNNIDTTTRFYRLRKPL